MNWKASLFDTSEAIYGEIGVVNVDLESHAHHSGGITDYAHGLVGFSLNNCGVHGEYLVHCHA